MRHYTPYVDEAAQHLINRLLDEASTLHMRQEALVGLGRHLAGVVHEQAHRQGDADICVVCDANEADSLGRGLLEALADEHGVPHNKLKLACFWNERLCWPDRLEHVAPVPGVTAIVKAYQEEVNIADTVLVVAASVLVDGSAVTANLRALADGKTPGPICVTAPIMNVRAINQVSAFAAEQDWSVRHMPLMVDEAPDEKVLDRLMVRREDHGAAFVPKIVRDRRVKTIETVLEP